MTQCYFLCKQNFPEFLESYRQSTLRRPPSIVKAPNLKHAKREKRKLQQIYYSFALWGPVSWGWNTGPSHKLGKNSTNELYASFSQPEKFLTPEKNYRIKYNLHNRNKISEECFIVIIIIIILLFIINGHTARGQRTTLEPVLSCTFFFK